MIIQGGCTIKERTIFMEIFYRKFYRNFIEIYRNL